MPVGSRTSPTLSRLSLTTGLILSDTRDNSFSLGQPPHVTLIREASLSAPAVPGRTASQIPQPQSFSVLGAPPSAALDGPAPPRPSVSNEHKQAACWGHLLGTGYGPAGSTQGASRRAHTGRSDRATHPQELNGAASRES